MFGKPRAGDGSATVRQGDKKSVSDVSATTANPVVAIAASDIHLSEKPPVARSVEPDWFAAQKRQLDELDSLARLHDCPIIYPGDIFHHWNSSANLINFALAYLPAGYAICGNHDLRHHRLDDVKKTSFWTLVEAGKLKMLPAGQATEHMEKTCVRMWSFPWGTDVVPLKNPNPLALEVAVIHAFIWRKDSGYLGAPEQTNLRAWHEKLAGYDVALFGDNHKTTTYNLNRNREMQPAIFNPGTFYRRKIDEKDHSPMVGLIHLNGMVERYYLKSVEADLFANTKKLESVLEGKLGVDLTEFLDELTHLSDGSLNFFEAVLNYLRTFKVSSGVRSAVLCAVEKKDA